MPREDLDLPAHISLDSVWIAKNAKKITLLSNEVCQSNQDCFSFFMFSLVLRATIIDFTLQKYIVNILKVLLNSNEYPHYVFLQK